MGVLAAIWVASVGLHLPPGLESLAWSSQTATLMDDISRMAHSTVKYAIVPRLVKRTVEVKRGTHSPWSLRVNNREVAGLEQWRDAFAAAEALDAAIAGGLDARTLRPSYRQGRYVAIADRSVLLDLGSDRVLAGQRANALRVALGAEPLTVAELEAALDEGRGLRLVGYASWYGQDFHGRYTASGEIFHEMKLTAAHRELPFNTLLEVTNLETGRSVVVRVNDRGPFVTSRILDLSRGAAERIGATNSGVVPVEAKVLQASRLTTPIPSEF